MSNKEEAPLVQLGQRAANGNAIFSHSEWDEIGTTLYLSPRELQIVQGVFDDAKEAAIARRLKISPHTVHTYLERIYRKLDVNSRVQMIVRVMARYLEMNNGHDRSQVELMGEYVSVP